MNCRSAVLMRYPLLIVSQSPVDAEALVHDRARGRVLQELLLLRETDGAGSPNAASAAS